MFDTAWVGVWRNEQTPARTPGGSMGNIPVIARLVAADGGEQWWPARAVRWTDAEVLVGWQSRPGDPASVQYVWLRADDVARVLIPANDAMLEKGGPAEEAQ